MYNTPRLRAKRICIIASRFPAIVLTALFASCTTLTSSPEEANTRPADGLVYYMPKRDIVVTVSRADPSSRKGSPEQGKKEDSPPKRSTGTTTTDNKAGAKDNPDDTTPAASGDTQLARYSVGVSTSSAYADLSRRYILRMPSNAIAKRNVKIGVSAQGLLGSAAGEATSQVTDLFKALATAGGLSSARTFTTETKDRECEPGRPYMLTISVETVTDNTPLEPRICGFEVTIARLGFQKTPVAPNKPRSSKTLESDSDDTNSAEREGVFYRYALPYRVKVTDPDGGPSSTFIAFSPSESGIFFLPAKRSLFSSKNKLDTQFSDGVLTSYEQDIDGELLALLKLPADVISAYFEAIGSIFPKKTTALQVEAAYLDAASELATAKLREQACREAVKTDDPEKIKTACVVEE